MHKLQTYYAYIDIDNPLACWEISIGRIACPKQKNSISLWGYNKIFKMSQNINATSKYEECMFFRECQLENFRKTFFPEKNSRLSSIFFFQNKESAHRAIDLWSRPRRFHDQVCQISFLPDSDPTVVDSNFITNELNGKDILWMGNYWKGEAHPKEEPLWEVIASGTGRIMKTKESEALQKRAYDRMIQTFPKCHLIHEICKIGFELGFDSIGRVSPFLLKPENSSVISGHLLLDCRLFKDDNFIQALYKELLRGRKLPPLRGEALGNTPDFSKYFFKLDLDQLNPIMRQLFDYSK